jgi:hypothetical protein
MQEMLQSLMIMNSINVRNDCLPNVRYSIDGFILGLSVKERARMLTTTIPPTTSNDKKIASPSNATGN